MPQNSAHCIPSLDFGRAFIAPLKDLGVKIQMEMSVEQVTNKVTSGIREESEAPDDGIGRIRRVRTEVAGLDRIREMTPQAGLASRIFSIAPRMFLMTESRARSECDEVLRLRP